MSSAAVWVFAGAAMLAARADLSQGAPGDAPQTQEIMVTGCVTEGTDVSVFILSNAVAKPEMENIPRTYRLVSDGADLDFTLHANHQVHTSGRAELKVLPEPPPGGRIDPRDLPAFAVKTIQSVSERCLTGDREAVGPAEAGRYDSLNAATMQGCSRPFLRSGYARSSCRSAF